MKFSKTFIFMSLVHLGVAIGVLFGYQPSKLEIFFAYLICALTFFENSLDSEGNRT